MAVSSADPIKSRPIYRYLLIQTFLMAIALQGWSAIYNNFAVNAAKLTGEQVGLIQSIREIPGFLSVTLILLLAFMSEMRLMSICVVVIGLGVAFAGFFPTFTGIILCSVISSVGFHYAEAVSQSLTLQHYSITESPIIIGVLRSVTAAASFGIGLVLFLLADSVPYSGLFFISGAGCIAGGLWGLFKKDISAPGLPQRNQLVVKKRYWLFYTMTLLSGARRQIFMVFSALLLIERFRFTLREMAFLFLVNHLINWILNRFIGKAINNFGERKLLTVKYIVLMAVFAAYAFSESRLLVTVLYVIEQLFFNFTIAIRTFFQKVADKSDIAPTMALGVTINHVAAVVVPFIGGLLWMYDYRVPFFMGIGFALCSVIAVQFIDWQMSISGSSKD